MPWNEKLFGVKTDNNSDIVTYSQKLFKNPEEKPKLSDWYTSPVDEMPLLKGIFSSQKENINWDLNLRKTFKYVVAAILGFVIVSIIGYGIFKNETILDLLDRLFIVAPILCWGSNIWKKLTDNIESLQELQKIYKSTSSYTMEDLKLYQKKIFEHRKAAYKIPDCFYNWLREHYENREKRIAEKET